MELSLAGEKGRKRKIFLLLCALCEQATEGTYFKDSQWANQYLKASEEDAETKGFLELLDLNEFFGIFSEGTTKGDVECVE